MPLSKVLFRLKDNRKSAPGWTFRSRSRVSNGSFKRRAGEPWQLIEPAWKMVLSNKALLPLLWEMFPRHPNLLPAYDSPDKLGDTWIRKSLFGREGSGLTVSVNGRQVTTPGEFVGDAFVYQQLCPPPVFEGRYPVIGSWIVRDESAGIGIREGDSPVTTNTSCFVPHYF